MKFPRLRRDKMPSDAEVAAFDESRENTTRQINSMIERGLIAEDEHGRLYPTQKGNDWAKSIGLDKVMAEIEEEE
jgi:hypothetical protein